MYIMYSGVGCNEGGVCARACVCNQIYIANDVQCVCVCVCVLCVCVYMQL